jgi:hypothetical protein
MTTEKQSLAERTRQRNALTWLSLDYGGVMAPLVDMEADLDAIARFGIENFMAISDEAWGIKEHQRDQTVELSRAEIDQDILLAEAKAATGRAKIAIERSVDEYVMAAKVYDAQVKGLIMGAKEYAALVEQEQLAVEAARAGLAVDKEALRLTKITADIYLETIHQAMVEADIAKAQVDVAKAHVRAALAGIEAGEAEIKLLEAQIQVYVAEADKATLQADVAMIFAEIMTKQLSATKLGVGRAEIVAQYAYIQSRLEDALALYSVRGLIEGIKTEAEVAMQAELALVLAAEKAEQDLRTLEANSALEALAIERGLVTASLKEEETKRQLLVAARTALNNARMAASNLRERAHTSAQELVNAAHKATYLNSSRTTTTLDRQTEYISG